MRQIFAEYLRKSVRKQEEAAALYRDRYESFVGDKYETPLVAGIAASTDAELDMLIKEQKFAERLANMYGQAAVHEVLCAILSEQRRTNDMLLALFRVGEKRS